MPDMTAPARWEYAFSRLQGGVEFPTGGESQDEPASASHMRGSADLV